MLDGWGPNAANLLTATRVVLTPLFMLAVSCADRSLLLGVTAVLIFAVVAASDVLDGWAARRWRTDSSAGRVFDHFADVGFLVLSLTTYVWLGVAPWWVPAAVAGSFGFYVIDSRRISHHPSAVSRQPPLVGSRIGHVGGVCNYVLVGVLVCNTSARIHLLSPAFLSLLFCLVPLYSGGAVVARLLSRRAAAPAVGVASTRE
jgi:CDP-diacylglycerol--glycerol-3-phosphate 3-phosphatidyltransferase